MIEKGGMKPNGILPVIEKVPQIRRNIPVKSFSSIKFRIVINVPNQFLT